MLRCQSVNLKAVNYAGPSLRFNRVRSVVDQSLTLQMTKLGQAYTETCTNHSSISLGIITGLPSQVSLIVLGLRSTPYAQLIAFLNQVKVDRADILEVMIDT
jgi:hypothetical protein